MDKLLILKPLLTLNFGKKLTLNICLLYRQPSMIFRQFLLQFEKLLLDLSSKNTDHSMIVGEMNIDTLFTACNCHNIGEYQLLLSSFGYSISNNEATRQTHASSTCIDHFISRVHLNVTTLKTSLSDHYALVAHKATFLEDTQSMDIRWRNFKFLQKQENVLKFLFVLTKKNKRIAGKILITC